MKRRTTDLISRHQLVLVAPDFEQIARGLQNEVGSEFSFPRGQSKAWTFILRIIISHILFQSQRVVSRLYTDGTTFLVLIESQKAPTPRTMSRQADDQVGDHGKLAHPLSLKRVIVNLRRTMCRL